MAEVYSTPTNSSPGPTEEASLDALAQAGHGVSRHLGSESQIVLIFPLQSIAVRVFLDVYDRDGRA